MPDRRSDARSLDGRLVHRRRPGPQPAHRPAGGPRPDTGDGHPGANDLDVGLAIGLLDDEQYAEISHRLRQEGFAPDHNENGNPTPQRWKLADFAVTVDFLLPPIPGAVTGGRVHKLEGDFGALIAPGLEVAFDERHEITVSGHTLKGETVRRRIPVCGPAAFAVLKSFAFADRGEPKLRLRPGVRAPAVARRHQRHRRPPRVPREEPPCHRPGRARKACERLRHPSPPRATPRCSIPGRRTGRTRRGGSRRPRLRRRPPARMPHTRPRHQSGTLEASPPNPGSARSGRGGEFFVRQRVAGSKQGSVVWTLHVRSLPLPAQRINLSADRPL
jgi:hypothetical protein